MSNMLGRTAPLDDSRSLPRGELIGSYSSYLDAQKVVDYLADQQFQVQRVSIIGNNLKSVERVTGRLTYPRVALTGAATGAWFGLFVGIILSLFSQGDTFVSIFTSMGLGAAFWMLFGVITYAFQRGKRDFTSTSQVMATSYDVICAPEVAAEARRLARQLPMTPGQADRPAAGYPAPPQPPERPQGWADPYADQPAAPPAQAPYPPAAPAAQAPHPQSTPPAPRPGSFPDLPDGRPQFGVRVQDVVRPEVEKHDQAGPAAGKDPGQKDSDPQDSARHDSGPHDSGRAGDAAGNDK